MTRATNQKAPGADNTEGFDTDPSNDLNYPTGERQRKALVTQIAELALHGHAVHQLQSGAFLVSKYGMTRYCGDTVELHEFAVQLGVSK